MNETADSKQGAEEHYQEVMNEAEAESPEAEEPRPDDKPRRPTRGAGWTPGTDVDDKQSQQRAPADAKGKLDTSGGDDYNREATDFARKHRR